MFKKFYHWLLLVSIGFFGIYLYKADYLLLGQVEWNYFLLAASIILVFLTFLLQSFSWKKALLTHNIAISFKASVHSHGLAILSKYIPGKVWVIVGRSGIIAEKGFGMQVTSSASLKEQLLYILVGLVLGFVPFLVYFGFTWIAGFIIASIVGLSLLLFSKKIHAFTLWLLSKIIRKNIDIPLLTLSKAMPIVLYVFLTWLVSSLGFYVFTLSIIPSVSWPIALAFPLSISYGILAVVVPGGIGVREGILTAYFTAAGVDTAQAVTVSVLSRLWYVAGEVFLFVLALVIRGKD